MSVLHLTATDRRVARSIVRGNLDNDTRPRDLAVRYARLSVTSLQCEDIDGARFWARCFAMVERLDHLRELRILRGLPTED